MYNINTTTFCNETRGKTFNSIYNPTTKQNIYKLNKRHQLNIRTSAFEKNTLTKNAKQKGMNLSEYVLTLAEDKPEPNKQLNTRQLK